VEEVVGEGEDEVEAVDFKTEVSLVHKNRLAHKHTSLYTHDTGIDAEQENVNVPETAITKAFKEYSTLLDQQVRPLVMCGSKHDGIFKLQYIVLTLHLE
jgi:hypothetical protein